MKDYKKVFKNETGFIWDSKKFEIHHIDRNRENNDFKNLILLPKVLHKKLHLYFNAIEGYRSFLDIENTNRPCCFIDDFHNYLIVKEEMVRIYNLINSLKYSCEIYGGDFKKCLGCDNYEIFLKKTFFDIWEKYCKGE